MASTAVCATSARPLSRPGAYRGSQTRIRVGIIDDHCLVRQGLRALLDREAGILVVGEAASTAAAMTMVASVRPDVVLLDLKLSGGSECEGLSLCAKLAGRFPGSRVLVLTTSSDEWLILQAIRQGAKGYVGKDVDLPDLLRAIRAVNQDGGAFDPRSANFVVRWLQCSSGESARAANAITLREREILTMLAEGLSNVAIGERLYISSATVKFHVANLLRKLGAKRRAEAVYAAVKMGLI